MNAGAVPKGETRRFACTACGRCCDRGPEMELGEAAAFADRFTMSLVLKVHSIPLGSRGERAAAWWHEQGSRIPLRAAFEENRRHLALFASRRRSDRRNARETWLMISAIVDDYGEGRCPALADGLCAVHERRPLTCRTVPLHYSRQPSVLKNYLDRFTATPGYKCETGTSPVILDGSRIMASQLRDDRDTAIVFARGDRRWKEYLLAIMDDPHAAAAHGLPTTDAVFANSNRGYATTLPMLSAWRVAEANGLLSSAMLRDICTLQAALIRSELARLPSAKGLHALLPLYEAEAEGRRV